MEEQDDDLEFEDEVEEDVLVEEPIPEELVTMNYRGEQVQVTKTKAIELAQKGFDYESKMAALREDSQDYAGFKAMSQWMDENPDKAARVQRIIAGKVDDPEEEEQEYSDWQDDFEEDGEEPKPKKQRMKTDREVQSLMMQVEELQKERNEKRNMEETSRMGKMLQQEVAKYPSLEEFGELAYAPILGVLSARPEADLVQVVKAVAGQFEAQLLRIKDGFVKKKTARLQTLPEDEPSGSVPTILHKRKYSGKDLDSGDLRRAVLASFKEDD